MLDVLPSPWCATVLRPGRATIGADLQIVRVRAVPSARVALKLQLVYDKRGGGERLSDTSLRGVATAMNVEDPWMAVVVPVIMAIAMCIAVVAIVASPTSHTTLSRARKTRNQSTVGTSG